MRPTAGPVSALGSHRRPDQTQSYFETGSGGPHRQDRRAAGARHGRGPRDRRHHHRHGRLRRPHRRESQLRTTDAHTAAQLATDDDAVDTLGRQLFAVLLDRSWAHGVGPAIDAAQLDR
jgi:hypothetical protein